MEQRAVRGSGFAGQFSDCRAEHRPGERILRRPSGGPDVGASGPIDDESIGGFDHDTFGVFVHRRHQRTDNGANGCFVYRSGGCPVDHPGFRSHFSSGCCFGHRPVGGPAGDQLCRFINLGHCRFEHRPNGGLDHCPGTGHDVLAIGGIQHGSNSKFANR